VERDGPVLGLVEAGDLTRRLTVARGGDRGGARDRLRLDARALHQPRSVDLTELGRRTGVLGRPVRPRRVGGVALLGLHLGGLVLDGDVRAAVHVEADAAAPEDVARDAALTPDGVDDHRGDLVPLTRIGLDPLARDGLAVDPHRGVATLLEGPALDRLDLLLAIELRADP